MTVVAITGDGATTLTIALAATWPAGRATASGRPLVGGPLVVEADPNGGSLAGWLDVPVQPSIATAAAAIGAGEAPTAVIGSMAHHTASGLRVLPAPVRRSAARRAAAASARGVPPRRRARRSRGRDRPTTEGAAPALRSRRDRRDES